MPATWRWAEWSRATRWSAAGLVPPAGIEPATHGLGAAMSRRRGKNLLGVEHECPVDRDCEVALEGAASLTRRLAFRPLASEEGPRSAVPPGLGERYRVERSVQLTVASSVQPVADHRTAHSARNG